MPTHTFMPPLTLRGVCYDPPLFCAPMAGITHSSFRRLLADFGGYGGLFTEMLSARMIIHEDPLTSPWLKRRPQEKRVIYQLLISDSAHLPATLARLAPSSRDGIDINLGCPAATVQQRGGGSDLFDDQARLCEIIRTIRRDFDGPLTVKIRLGRPTPDWRTVLHDRLKLFEDEGIDAITLHPRFAEESLNRYQPRHTCYAELATETRLPIIANGDITGLAFFQTNEALLAPCAGLMIGRMAAARPWIFAQWHQPDLPVDHHAVWTRLCDYMEEDFELKKGLIRLKIFTPYFARNFVFGHTLFASVQSAPDWPTARDRADEFLSSNPALNKSISLSGL
ncbi:MAG: tRNA-dihydrouridine synthase family protein [bacterium]